jgi:hypothetical protein
MLIVIFLWWYPSYRCRLKLLQIVFRFFWSILIMIFSSIITWF